MQLLNRTVFIYARFSPRPNAAECESVERQIEELKLFASSMNQKVQGVFSDENLSGGDDWKDRQGLLDLIASASKGDLIIVRAFDRLFRDTGKGLTFAAMAAEKGIEIYAVQEQSGFDDDPASELFATIMLAFGQYQRRVTASRTKIGQKRNVRNGRNLGAAPAYGWEFDPENPKQFKRNEKEYKLVEEMRQLHEAGLSWYAIAKNLNDRGVRNRAGSKFVGHKVKKLVLRHIEQLEYVG